MGKHNTAAGILVLAVILTIATSTILVVAYATGVLNAALAFASSDQIAKFQACGITAPAELFKLQADVPNLLLAIYIGLPCLMILISLLMFIAGHYYGKEGTSSIETTTTTSSPNRKHGKYAPGRRIEQTRTQKSSRNE